MFGVFKKFLLASVCFAIPAASALSQEAKICNTEMGQVNNIGTTATAAPQAKLNAIVVAMQTEMNKTIEENPVPNYSDQEVMANFAIDIDWKNEDIILDVPQVAMRLQEWKFDVPQVTMKTQEWIFHTPSVRMVAKKVGQYPEFKCSGFKCSVYWTDIITHVPETFMEEQKVSLDIPEMKMDTTSIKLHIPEVKMGPQKVVVGIPHFTIREAQTEIKQAGAALSQRTAEIKAKYEPQIEQVKVEMQEAVNKLMTASMGQLYQCQMGENSSTYAQGNKSFEDAIQKVEAAGATYNKPEMKALQEQMQIQADQIRKSYEEQKVRFESEVLQPAVQEVAVTE